MSEYWIPPKKGGVRLAQNQIEYLLAVRTPRLFSPSWSDGQFQVSMEGTPSETYSLRTSSNWLDWSTVTNVTLSTNPATVIVPAPGNQMFYRMVTPSVP